MNKKDALTAILFIIIIAPLIGILVNAGPVRFMTVTGDSMEPAITSNDIIVVTAAGQLAVGDVVSYRYRLEDGGVVTITHRIVEIIEGGYITRGDSYDKEDSYMVAQEDVIGVMRVKIPLLGALVHFAGTVAGLLVLVIVPAVIIITLEVRKIIAYRRAGA